MPKTQKTSNAPIPLPTGHFPIESNQIVIPKTFACESMIRDNVMSLVDQPVRKLSAEQIKLVGLDPAEVKSSPKTREEKLVKAEEWIVELTSKLRDQGRLMTEQQYLDWT